MQKIKVDVNKRKVALKNHSHCFHCRGVTPNSTPTLRQQLLGYKRCSVCGRSKP